MKCTLRYCLLAVLLTSAGTAYAQEDPPVPEDPATTEAEVYAEPDPEPDPETQSPVSNDAPVGRVETVRSEATPVERTATDESEEVSEKAQAEIAPAEPEEKRLKTGFQLRSIGSSANNLDLRPLDNETFIDIYDSDDRGTIAYTQIAAEIEYQVLDDTAFEAGVSHLGAWGGDSLGAANAFGGIFYVDRLNVDWEPVAGENFTFGTIVGRQRFSIGGSSHDFLFDDVVDAVSVKFDLGQAGRLRLLPIEIITGSRPDDFTFGAAFGYAGPDSAPGGIGFDGDTNTFRFGGVYELTELVEGFEARLFGFYADIGAGGAPHTGADRSFYGAQGNFADNDYNWMGGARVGYTLDGETFDLGIHGEFARSGGLDRKATQVGVRDVTANGNAFGAAVEPRIDLTSVDLRFIGQFFYADGGNYTGGEGLLFNYGFVGMKGAQAGGINMNRYAGWHPTAYVGTRGVHYSPQDFSRKSGTMLIHGGAGVTVVEKVSLDLDLFLFRDTGSTNLSNFDNLGTVADELPFGYTEADLIPQERLGKSLGLELNAKLGYAPNEVLSFFAQGGVFLPGEYYTIEIPRTGGSALGAEDPATFWAALAGAALTF